jgi:hypothetical protein
MAAFWVYENGFTFPFCNGFYSTFNHFTSQKVINIPLKLRAGWLIENNIVFYQIDYTQGLIPVVVFCDKTNMFFHIVLLWYVYQSILPVFYHIRSMGTQWFPHHYEIKLYIESWCHPFFKKWLISCFEMMVFSFRKIFYKPVHKKIIFEPTGVALFWHTHVSDVFSTTSRAKECRNTTTIYLYFYFNHMILSAFFWLHL